MRSLKSGYVFTALVVIGAILMLPVRGHAQESTVSGTLTDPTGAVLPGVTVTATHTETGNTFQAVTDERGGYRLLVRVGEYRNDALDGRRNGERCRRSAFGRYGDDEGRRQHRPETDAGTAAQRPKLDGPDTARAGCPAERGGRARAEPAGIWGVERRWAGCDDQLPLLTRQ